MTFKEKLAKEHPERINQNAMGGCDGCPCEYGYEKENSDCNGSSDLGCNECWNREMPVPMTAEEAWEIAHKIIYMDKDRLLDVFGVSCNTQLFSSHTPQEVKAKFDEWESKQIRVGDVITTMNGSAEHLVLRVENNPSRVLHVCNISNGTVQTLTCEVKKTGKHIDIQSLLEQIGKEE